MSFVFLFSIEIKLLIIYDRFWLTIYIEGKKGIFKINVEESNVELWNGSICVFGCRCFFFWWREEKKEIHFTLSHNVFTCVSVNCLHSFSCSINWSKSLSVALSSMFHTLTVWSLYKMNGCCWRRRMGWSEFCFSRVQIGLFLIVAGLVMNIR